MAVDVAFKTHSHNAETQSGQSIVEFLILLPFLIGLTVIMIRANTAIQFSIVDQQYARAQAFFLAFNHNTYPSLLGSDGAPALRSVLTEDAQNQLVLGVSNQAPPDSDEANFQPDAQVQRVARTLKKAGAIGAPGEQPTERGHVRVRNTVGMCIPSTVIQAGGRIVPNSSANRLQGLSPQSFLLCRSTLGE